jgi:hypothetical protein
VPVNAPLFPAASDLCLKKCSYTESWSLFDGKEILTALCIESLLKEELYIFDSIHNYFLKHRPVFFVKNQALEHKNGLVFYGRLMLIYHAFVFFFKNFFMAND